jgi:hypothetical protein
LGTKHRFAVNIRFQALYTTPNVLTITKVETAISVSPDRREVFCVETNTDLPSHKDSESSRYADGLCALKRGLPSICCQFSIIWKGFGVSIAGMANPLRICKICSEQFELVPGKPGLSTVCSACSGPKAIDPSTVRKADKQRRLELLQRALEEREKGKAR